jgi:exosortase A-associated hydrolase 2
MANGATPLFIDSRGTAGGQRFCVLHRPHKARGAVVYVHPFAEEMNKSRRMAALQSRAFADAGYAVLQYDLYGCGDSAGDFGDATWDDWIDDVADAAHWLRSQFDVPLTLWGLRAGCLIASEAARRRSLACDFVFWQPMTSGKLVLQQHLRLQLAKDMLDGQARGTTDRLRARLAAGESVEIAGYALNPGLAQGLDGATLAPAGPGRSAWVEVSTRNEASLLPATAAAAERWRASGHGVTQRVVQGPSFWTTTEIEEVPALVEATLDLIGGEVEATCTA